MTTAPTPAGAMAIFGENKREFHQLSAIEKRLHWRPFVSELLQIQQRNEKGQFTNVGGVLAYNLLLPEEDNQRMFPEMIVLDVPAHPEQFPGNASQAALKAWEILAKLVEALKFILALLKEILMTQCREEIQHLEDDLTGFINVSVKAMFLAVRSAHGQLTPVDREALRQRTLKPFDRSSNLKIEIGGWTKAHVGMTRVGTSVSESDKLREITVQLRAYHPVVADIVTDYEKETDIGARTWSSLIEFALLRESRLPVPLIGGSRGQLHAVSEEESALDDHPSAAAAKPDTRPAAGGQVSISTERLKELEEAEKFAKAAPAPQYCFSCGWGGHNGLRCNKMSAKDGTLRDGFTKKQTEAKKPGTVDGKAGATKLWTGFRKPN
jgi:hypothetical protein